MLVDKKIAVVVSHPIQHFCPQYASWAKVEGVTIKVFFGSNLGATKYFDQGFSKEINWTNLYLDEFDHDFLNGDESLQPDANLSARNLEPRLTDFKPDIVIFYGYFQKLSRQTYVWARKNKVKIAFISDAELRQKRPLWKRLVKYPFLISFYKHIDYFLTVGDANEAYYIKYNVPQAKFRRMHFPIDIRTYDEAFANKGLLRQIMRNEKQIAPETIVLSVVGKLVSWKSQAHLIELLKKFETENDLIKFHLLIAGSGPMEEDLKKLAQPLQSNVVTFLGFISPLELPAIYAATDIYIHPSFIEPHSLSVSEAIYMGCPAIVADTTGSWGDRDDVQPGRNGFVYKFGDIEELSLAVTKIIETDLLKKFSMVSKSISMDFQKAAHGNFLKLL